MGKSEGLFVIIILLVLLQGVSVNSNIHDADQRIQKEIKKLTYHAEEYEAGNENYAQLLIYSSSVRQRLNEMLGAVGKYEGGLLKQDQIRAVLGEPNDMTRWVWIEGQNHDKKVDNPVPFWRKIVFDGKKIQIRLSAHPSVFTKSIFKEEQFNNENSDKKNLKRLLDEELKGLENKIIYRLNFDIDFKKPEEQLDIKNRIGEIQGLAEAFNSNPTKNNKDILAEKSVNAEKAFDSYFRQGGSGGCEDLMKNIFGSENLRGTSGIIVHEIDLFDGEDFVTIMRLEMCEDCDWNWINLNMWFEGRGKFKHPKDVNFEEIRKEKYNGWSSSEFKIESAEILDEIKKLLKNGNYDTALAYSNRLQGLNNAWNEKSNNLYDQVDKEFRSKIDGMSEEEKHRYYQDYGWIKDEQEKRKRIKELQFSNYEERKNFYLNLFSAYSKKEFYFQNTEYEKRLVEEFKVRGKEICDNNKDDNDNGNIDCSDSQCGGKICGKDILKVIDGNTTKEVERNLFCIAGTCQAKEETIKKTGPVCGNHICEEGEKRSSEISDSNSSEIILTIHGTCPEDCVLCPEHPPLECSGKVVFMGKDENGCQLKPLCVKEDGCYSNDDCNFLCGVGFCKIEEGKEKGKCELRRLEECKPIQCIDGEKQIERCNDGKEIIAALCKEGLWVDLFIECPVNEDKVCCKYKDSEDVELYEWINIQNCKSSEDGVSLGEIIDNKFCEKEKESCKKTCRSIEETAIFGCPGRMEISGAYPDCNCDWVCERLVGEECTVKSDCGAENDVCSNGRCVTIPEIKEIKEEKEKQDSEEKHETEEVLNKDQEEELIEEPEKEISEIGKEGLIKERSESESESQNAISSDEEINERSKATGEVIFNFFKALAQKITIPQITGAVVEEDKIETNTEPTEPIPEPAPKLEKKECPAPGEPPKTEENCWYKEVYDDNGCISSYKVECEEFEKTRERDLEEGRRKIERHEEEERRRKEKECEERCERECYDMKIRPCVDKCIFEDCGEKFECEVDEARNTCENSCLDEKDATECKEVCYGKCMKGENTWEEPEREEHKEMKTAFMTGGGCRKAQKQTEGFIWFNGWGDPFGEIQESKHKYYSGGQADWCKWDFESIKKQRKELESSLNNEFVKWFFEGYMANSAEEWEQHVSGIFELYWKDVDISREMIMRMDCLGTNALPDHRLINIEYQSEHGSIKLWEEVKTVKMNEIGKEVTIISPYMEFWIFPPKEFIKYEMKKAMKMHEFPGPPEEKMERKNQEGPTAEEREFIRQDQKFMKRITEISDRYGGNVDIAVQFKDYENDEVVFNIYVKVNEKDILIIEPMTPEELPKIDISVEIDFQTIYDMVYSMEKEVRGVEIESPPWDKKLRKGKVKEITDGIKMYFKMRKIISSAKITPENAEKDIERLFKEFFELMKDGEKKGEGFKEERNRGEEKGVWDAKERITGEIIS